MTDANAAAAVLSRLAQAGIQLKAAPPDLIATPKGRLTDELRALVRAHKPELIRALTAPAGKVDPAADQEALAAAALVRRLGLEMERRPDVDLIVLADDVAVPETVLVAVGRRGAFACCLRIAPERYDGLQLLELVRQHGGTVH